MIIVAAVTLGFLAVMLRSALGCALIASGIILAFALAALVTAGAVSWIGFGLAILGYNAGIAGALGSMLLVTSLTHRNA